jgi:hypothetical protein
MKEDIKMATNLKTIKFGENGEIYNVNAFDVERNGELSENSTVIDFGGTFEKGLTEINAVFTGVSGTSGDYIYIGINGTKTNFITYNPAYTEGLTIKLKKIGTLWDVNIYGIQLITNAVPYVKGLLKNVSEITSLEIEAYSTATPFAAGTKYALEGR